MATVSYKCTENKIQARLSSMIERARDPRAFLNTVIFDMYKQAQLNRWATENESETGRWQPIKNKYYEARKRRRYAGFPGSGQKLMIAKGNLVYSASGKKNLKKVVTNRGMILSIDDGAVPYAKYAATLRPIMSFGPNTIGQMRLAIGRFMMGGK